MIIVSEKCSLYNKNYFEILIAIIQNRCNVVLYVAKNTPSLKS